MIYAVEIDLPSEEALYDALDESGVKYRVHSCGKANGDHTAVHIRAGSRGGHTESLAEAQEIYSSASREELDEVRNFILWTAAENDEVHADDLAELEVESLNIIGVAFNSLARSGFLEKLNKSGETEHRKATSRSSHGRASYVWRLTRAGVRLLNRAANRGCQPLEAVR